VPDFGRVFFMLKYADISAWNPKDDYGVNAGFL